MSKNLVINGVTYNGIESMEIPTTEGEKVTFVPEDEAGGGVELPDLTNPATASDIVSGKQAIDGDGNVVEGTVKEKTATNLTLYNTTAKDSGNNKVQQVVKFTEDTLMRKDSQIYAEAPLSDFGDAGVFDVKAGKTFTSAAGFKRVGRYVPPHIDPLPSLNNPSLSTDILENKEAIDAEGNKLTGTMPNIGAVNANLSIGGSYTIPEGYHDGTGVVQGAALPTLTSPATAGDILSGKEVINADGAKLTGSMPVNSPIEKTLRAGGSYTIPSGHHNGTGKIIAMPLANQTSGTATAADIASGKTAWVKGVKLTGTFTVEEEIAEQDTLIANILTALDTKAAGGGGASVQTATVNYLEWGLSLFLVYTAYVGGAFVTTIIDSPYNDSGDPVILENVVVGSSVFVVLGDSMDWNLSGAQLDAGSEQAADSLGGSYSFKILSDATIEAL